MPQPKAPANEATKQPDDNARALEKQEGGKLRWTASLVLAWLLALSIASIAEGLFLLGAEPPLNVGKLCLNIDMLNALLCVLGGTLGSSVSALISAADRVSHGWEFKDGTKYPTDETKDKFVHRMVPWFIVRPFLGSAMGLLVYVGITGGYLIAVQKGTSAGTFSWEGLLFLAFLGGLFAKTFLEKLRTTFDVLFGEKKKQSNDDASKGTPGSTAVHPKPSQQH
jgi:hypothetical protein